MRLVALLLLWLTAAPMHGAPALEGVEFFESRIRPLLVQDCYECHATHGKQKGGLVLDHREALLKGGESGPALVPGAPEKSLLLRLIRHEEPGLEMPKSGPQWEESILTDFEAWIAMGAPDPRKDPPDAESSAEANQDWDAVMERRKQWWSFQPVRAVAPPEGEGHPVDRFIDQRLIEEGLERNPRADPETLLRRLSFVVRGLPPSPAEVRAFTADPSDTAFASMGEAFLDSPRFGERWARHWMDWVRYADSHGSEGDPMIPYSWRYRDYLIESINADIPYNQLVKEHIAGDLLKTPRIDAKGCNASAIGPAHLRMVFHGFAPTDALEEQLRFTDDQINVVSKAFMGLTVSCARCHNHKFDAISQNDFYRWYGIFASCPPGTRTVDGPSNEVDAKRAQLASLKEAIRHKLADHWLKEIAALSDRLREDPLNARIAEAKDPNHLLYPFSLSAQNKAQSVLWHRWSSGPAEPNPPLDWAHRDGPSVAPSEAGAFAIALQGEHVLLGIYPSGTYSHLISSKDRGVILTPRILLDQPYDLWLNVIGDGGAFARYAVQGYPRSGTVYPVKRINGNAWRWERFDLSYWEGDHIHVELTTAADQPVLADTGAERSWFGLRRAVLTPKGQSPPPQGVAYQRLLASSQAEATVDRYKETLSEAVMRWKRGTVTDHEAALLDASIHNQLLSNQLSAISTVEPLVRNYREIEESLPVPTRVPAVLEKDSFDQPFYVRGDHKQPGQPVSRGFLDAFDATPYEVQDSGRLALAEDLVREDNPLARRVIVNRVWHHLFGEGLVRTPDNFGRLGERPSHPELLDYLAKWFSEHDQSIKALIGFLIRSETWKASSSPSLRASQRDPDNRLLSHAHVRRLEAEALRDSLFAVAGSLDTQSMHGPPVTGDAPRRSVYLRVKRNDLDPFLSTFDAPVPASSKGRREVTNVPGQSLTLLNDRMVIAQARAWARAHEGTPDAIGTMILEAFGRAATTSEISDAEAYVTASTAFADDFREEEGKLEQRVDALQEKLDALEAIATQRVITTRDAQPGSTDAPIEAPIARWDFSKSLNDEEGSLPVTAHGKARLSEGALQFDGRAGSHGSTPPLAIDLRAKTLAATVRLNALDQRGGGVITVQTLDGAVFDSIVIGEQQAGHWIAGSNVFARTKDFGGPKEIANEWVHLAIVYREDGDILAYRNGAPYGKSYRSDGPVIFRAGQSQVLFGNRHGPPQGNRLLQGTIRSAALFDRALSAEEVGAIARGDRSFVTQKARLAAMTTHELARRADLLKALAEATSALNAHQAHQPALSGLADFAHALFNAKEFLYLR